MKIRLSCSATKVHHFYAAKLAKYGFSFKKTNGNMLDFDKNHADVEINSLHDLLFIQKDLDQPLIIYSDSEITIYDDYIE